MSRAVKSLALVIHWIRHRESSRIVTLFCREEGKVTVIAKGMRRGKGRGYLAGLEPLNLVEAILHIKPTRSVQNISQVSLGRAFYRVREDLRLFTYGSLIGELLQRSFTDMEANPEAFDAALRALGFLEQGEIIPSLVVSKFMLDLSESSGFALNPLSCPVCGKEDFKVKSDNLFLYNYGMFTCSECLENLTGQIIIRKPPFLGKGFPIVSHYPNAEQEAQGTRYQGEMVSGEMVMILRSLAHKEPSLWKRLRLYSIKGTDLLYFLERFLKFHNPHLSDMRSLRILSDLETKERSYTGNDTNYLITVSDKSLKEIFA